MTTENTATVGDELVVVHPATGQAIGLKAPTNELADVLLELTDLDRALEDFRRDVEAELIRRMDRMNKRTASLEAGEVRYELETNAPSTATYSPTTLRARLLELVDEDLIDRDLVDLVVVDKVPPKFEPGKRVDGREVNKLKTSTEPKVLAAVAAARTVSPQRRTLKVARVEAKR